MGLYIRLNNKFVYKKGKRFYLTKITKPEEWKEMTTKQKERVMGKDVTSKIKALLKKHGSKANMNFKTGSSKKKIRKTVRKGKKKRSLKGGD